MPNKVAFSNENISLGDIDIYFNDCIDSLDYYFNFNNAPLINPARFFGYSRDEVNDELKRNKDILNQNSSLNILSSLEAQFRIDYLVRCQSKMKDSLSREFREIHKAKQNKASLTDDIIATWRMHHPQYKAIFDSFQKAIDYRNWLAHGKYWKPKKSPHVYRYDYLSLYTLANQLINNLPLCEVDT